MSDRPILLSIVAVLAILAGLFMLIAGAVTCTISPEFWAETVAQAPDIFGKYTLSEIKDTGMFLLIVGTAVFVIGAALFAGWSFSWYLVVLALAAVIAIGAYRIYDSGTARATILTIALAAAVLLYMSTSKVRGHFRRA